MVVFLLWLTWSIGGVLTAPGTDTTSARLAEWGRFHGLGWAVDELETLQYQLSPPKVGGTLAGGIPKVSAARPTPAPHASIAASPAATPPQAQPPLPGEAVWQPLVSVHGNPAIRAAFLRPDAQHTSYLVGVAWRDQKQVKRLLHPGYN